MHEESINFERENYGKVLVFLIRWIGWDTKIYNDQEYLKYNFNPALSTPRNFIFGTSEYKKDRFGITIHGELVCIEDYCVHLANQDQTHVILIQDLNEHNKYVENHVEWNKAYFELNLKDNTGLGRFCFYQSSPLKINDLFKKLAEWSTDKSTGVLLMPDMLK